MKHYRISKYDPRKRDPQGIYLDLLDWTGPGDIGRIIRGRKFTSGDFLEMEARYIRAIHRFHFASQLPHLRVTNVVGIDKEWRNTFRKNLPDLYDPRFDDFHPCEDQVVTGEEIDIIAMMNMRNFLGCRLHVDEEFFIHFGWDFYLHIGIRQDGAKLGTRTEKDGLFVDEMPSPFAMPPGFSAPYRIEAYSKRSQNRDDSLTKKLDGYTKHDLRPAFGYSDEHPLFGTFEIEPDIQEKLQKLVAYEFDPDLYTYVLRRDPWM